MSNAPLHPDFPKEEFERRYKRARKMMEAAELDALLVTEEQNYAYLTGHRSEQNRLDKVRPHVVLLPLDGDPVIFVMPFEERDVRLTTWISSIQVCRFMEHVKAIGETLQAVGLSDGTIGCELGREQHLKMNISDFRALESRLPDASFVDASDILLGLRVVKSPAEVARCRQAAEAAAHALDCAYQQVKPGMDNREVARLVRRYVLEEDTEGHTFLTVVSGKDFMGRLESGLSTVPTPRVLESGDTLTLDTGALVGGYASDVCRVAVVGRASQRQKDFYRSMIELHHTCFDILKAGRTCEEVAVLCQGEVARFSGRFLPASPPAPTKPGHTAETVGRIGHGVGRETTEYPSIRPGEKVVLEAGMIFTLNPSFLTEFGYFNSEENLLVTERGYELLSTPASEPELRELG